MRTTSLRFEPLIKQTIWGGRRLGERLGKPIGDGADYAESWEIVDHGDDQSVVLSGDLAGQTLGQLFRDRREWLMGSPWCDANSHANSFPLLFKFLDCNRVLSVQVHPDDAYGATMSPPDLGKTEAWVILHSEPESVIYAGLKPGIDRDALSKKIREGRTEDALHAFHPETGDCVFIPAGTVHALGGGLVVAEIQQSSNTTFRLFDWNRVDANGQSRPLHIEPSLDVTDYQRGPIGPIRNQVSSGIEQLVSCDKFDLQRLQDVSSTIGGDQRCHLLSAIGGATTLEFEGSSEQLLLGESVLLPAASGAVSVSVGKQATLLWMSPPDCSAKR